MIPAADRLVRVDVLRAHDNAWGEKEHKEPGDAGYRLPRGQAENLIAQRLVQLHVRVKRAKPAERPSQT